MDDDRKIPWMDYLMIFVVLWLIVSITIYAIFFQSKEISLKTYRHEGCEFVVGTCDGKIAMIHKPLCDNPDHLEEDEFATPERLTDNPVKKHYEALISRH